MRQSLWLLAALLAAGLAACQTQPWQGFPAADAARVWPAPPETPRIAYVMQIRKHQDLFDEAGGLRRIAQWFTGGPESRLVRPYALALHPQGGLLVTDPGRQIVHFFCWGRQRYIAVGPKLEGGLPSPVGVAALPDGRILVSDSRLRRIETFDAEGRPLGAFGDPALFERPAGLAVAAERGEVYVADVTAHRIGVLDLSGRLLRWFGRRGALPGEFNFPTHLALGPDGSLAVTDSMNFRVQVLRPDGAFVRSVGAHGDAPGLFAQPKGVVLDAHGRIVAVEGLYGALEFFDPEGKLLLNLGQSGADPGEFWLPAGLCFDPREGLLFVADSYNARLQVFRMMEGMTTP